MEPQALHEMSLFQGMGEKEIREALTALAGEERAFPKGVALLRAGTVTSRMGVVLAGSVTVESNDVWGNRTILSHVGRGQCFAETYALLEDQPMLVDVTANEDCRVLFLTPRGVALSGRAQPAWALTFAANLLMISAHKNLHLSGRGFHTSPKSIRGRILAYLNSVGIQKGCREFDIPFDRQQLADYLNVERTALSKELGKMSREGYFTLRKNHFALRGSWVME